MVSQLQSLLLSAGLWAVSVARSDDIVLNQFEYCIRYFGSVSASLTLPKDGVPQYNYNGTIRCPTEWSFPTIKGATLELCPPSSASYDKPSDGIAIAATLSFRGQISEELDRPIDALVLRDLLITNGSVQGPFSSNGKPAVLEPGQAPISSELLPTWTINGTQDALIDTGDHKAGFDLDCNNLQGKQKYQYCGFAQDEDDGGCWTHQAFSFSMKTPLNFTILFNNHEADVWINVTNPYNNSALTTAVEIKFGGTRDLPSVVDYDFWTNSEQVYEVYKNEESKMEFQPDKNKMPVFWNNTRSGEWYATVNQTYSQTSGATARSVVTLATQLMVSIVVLHTLI